MTHDAEAGAVPPALTPSQWDEVRGRADWQREAAVDRRAQTEHALSHFADGNHFAGVAAPLPAAIAVANALRDDADPGKLTWQTVGDMRKAAVNCARVATLLHLSDPAWRATHDLRERLERHADAIAALLPPREGARD